jgi:cellobiose-specific phosphotransferase system component IIB
MKKATNKMAQKKNNNMRAEYDFKGGVRGKHYRTMQAGYTITIHKADGKTIVKDIMPKGDAVLLEPDVKTYFPDSESVNKALRCLIPLLPKKNRAKAKHH